MTAFKDLHQTLHKLLMLFQLIVKSVQLHDEAFSFVLAVFQPAGHLVQLDNGGG